ncbi:MAG: hypothetical protein AAF989_06720 [Planctomycetota bacterium]
MKRQAFTFALLFITGSSFAIAQPPGGRGGPGRGGPGQGRGPEGGPPPSPIMEALDADGDQIISADELEGAVKSLVKLDSNSDGKLSGEELHPAHRGGPPEHMASDRGNRDRGNRGRENRDRGDSGRGDAGRGGPDREGRGPGAGPRRGEGGGGRGGERGGMDPERMLEHAMQFDADADEKLDADELRAFMADVAGRRGQAGPPQRGEARPDRPGRGRPDQDGRGEGRPRRPE